MSDLIDSIGEVVTDELGDPLTPVHEGIKNMSSDDFTISALVVIIAVLGLIMWLVFRQPQPAKPMRCQHRCEVHTIA